MIDLSKYKIVIFDCDGVILDSNKCKSDAFTKALAGFDSNSVQDFIKYHKLHGGVSRFVKFDYFFKNILKMQNYTGLYQEALDKYAKLCAQGLLACAEINGIRDVLNYLQKKQIPCFVASGGDQFEVQTVFKERGLDKFFQGIYGSPKTKLEHLAQIKQDGYLADNNAIKGIYFGDAKSDMDAAQYFSLDFVFVSDASEWKDGLEQVIKSGALAITNFKEIIIEG